MPVIRVIRTNGEPLDQFDADDPPDVGTLLNLRDWHRVNVVDQTQIEIDGAVAWRATVDPAPLSPDELDELVTWVGRQIDEEEAELRRDENGNPLASESARKARRLKKLDRERRQLTTATADELRLLAYRYHSGPGFRADWRPALDGRTLDIYMLELIAQIEVADETYKRIAAAVDGTGGTDAWGPIQAFLSAAGLVSKILFPTPDAGVRGDSRGTQLRIAIGLKASPSLEENTRPLRNVFEHFDEKLDDWVDRHQGAQLRYYIDKNIGAEEDVRRAAGNSAAPILRNFDPGTTTLSFLDKRVQLHALWTDIVDLRPRCEKWRRWKGFVR